MMKSFQLKYLFIAVLLFSASILAQSFTASLSSKTIAENDQFELSFTFSGSDINNLTNFTPPSFRDFHVLSGPNYSTSMQIINGAVSASKSLSYILQPNKPGTFKIGSASISYNNKKYSSEPVTIEVVKGQLSQQQKQDEYAVTDQEIADNLFIKATVDKQRAYQGEQITVTYKLYTRLNIASQMSVSKLPQYQGFWAEELETSSTIMFTNEVVNGKQFRVGVLKKVALFPNQTGNLSVTPLELKIPVQLQRKKKSGNIFDDFFNDPFFGRGETIEYNAKSNTVKVDVNQLPDQSKPSYFNGAVGDFTINSELDKKNDIVTNEPLSLKVDITGTGNIQLLNVPEINLPSGLDKFEPKTSEQIKRTSKIAGKKSIEYLIVPRTPGKKEIPAIEFSYFNPSKKEYVTLRTKSYSINVEQGETVPGLTSSKEDVKVLGDDIRYIKTSSGSIDKKGDLILFQFGFWAAAIIPLFGLVGLIAWKKRDEKLAGNVQLLKYQRAEKIAKNRLKTARKLMQQNNNSAFYSEISQALYGYLEDKFQIPKSEFTLDRAVDELQKNEIDTTLIGSLKNCAEKCEYVRFAPQSNGVAAMNDMYNESANIIIEIERSLSVKKDA